LPFLLVVFVAFAIFLAIRTARRAFRWGEVP
jgi:hypothetical protein